jgi:hypothetical protein
MGEIYLGAMWDQQMGLGKLSCLPLCDYLNMEYFLGEYKQTKHVGKEHLVEIQRRLQVLSVECLVGSVCPLEGSEARSEAPKRLPGVSKPESSRI